MAVEALSSVHIALLKIEKKRVILQENLVWKILTIKKKTPRAIIFHVLYGFRFTIQN